MSGTATATLGQLFATAHLTPAQRSVAHYILDHEDEVGLLSSPALAERVGVSQPSVARFVTAIGFDSYSAFQCRVAEQKSAVDVAQGENLYERAVVSAATSLASLAQSVRDSSEIEQMASALAASPVLPVIGLRTAAGLATTFSTFASKIHGDVRLFTEGGSSMLDGLLEVSRSGATWALGIVLPRYPRESLRALELLKAQGCNIAVITDHVLSPAARFADLSIIAPIDTELIFDSQVAPSMTVSLLLEAIAGAKPIESQERLEAFDELADAYDLFVE